MAKTRTFLGVAATGEVLDHAQRVVARLRRITDSVKWVEPENLHWTLHFLGEIDDQEIAEVCLAGKRATVTVAAFTLGARGVGAFPTAERPRTLWIGAGQGGTEFSQLHDALDEVLRPLGFRGEHRRFVPHLTLGRIGRAIQPAEQAELAAHIKKLAELDAGAQGIDEVSIYASRLRREGPEYQVLGHLELG